MAVLNMPTKDQLESQVKVALQEFDRIVADGNWTKLEQFFDDTTDAVLLAAPYNWSQAQINVVKAAFNLVDDVRALYLAANGAQFQVKQITGTGL